MVISEQLAPIRDGDDPSTNDRGWRAPSPDDLLSSSSNDHGWKGPPGDDDHGWKGSRATSILPHVGIFGP
jgi:hypothetical protein